MKFVIGLPACSELHRTNFPQNRDVGSLLRLSGTVTRVTSPKMLEYRREYICSKCKEIFQIKVTKITYFILKALRIINIKQIHFIIYQAEYELHYAIKPPLKCININKCSGTTFTNVTVIDQQNYKDYQEIKIQEQISKLSIGTVPQSMWASLEDDLVDSCKPGDDIIIWYFLVLFFFCCLKSVFTNKKYKTVVLLCVVGDMMLVMNMI